LVHGCPSFHFSPELAQGIGDKGELLFRRTPRRARLINHGDAARAHSCTSSGGEMA
jgi:hypothetical protein